MAKLMQLKEQLRKALECPVCSDTMEQTTVRMCPNGHAFCNDCRSKMLLCPICRNPNIDGRCIILEDIANFCRDSPTPPVNVSCQTSILESLQVGTQEATLPAAHRVENDAQTSPFHNTSRVSARRSARDSMERAPLARGRPSIRQPAERASQATRPSMERESRSTRSHSVRLRVERNSYDTPVRRSVRLQVERDFHDTTRRSRRPPVEPNSQATSRRSVRPPEERNAQTTSRRSVRPPEEPNAQATSRRSMRPPVERNAQTTSRRSVRPPEEPNAQATSRRSVRPPVERNAQTTSRRSVRPPEEPNAQATSRRSMRPPVERNAQATSRRSVRPPVLPQDASRRRPGRPPLEHNFQAAPRRSVRPPVDHNSQASSPHSERPPVELDSPVTSHRQEVRPIVVLTIETLLQTLERNLVNFEEGSDPEAITSGLTISSRLAEADHDADRSDSQSTQSGMIEAREQHAVNSRPAARSPGTGARIRGNRRRSSRLIDLQARREPRRSAINASTNIAALYSLGFV